MKRKVPCAGAIGAGLLAIAIALPMNASADPPPWAPAHGYRDKHRHHDDDDDYDRPPPPAAVAMPYGLAQGTCHRDLIGAALGGAAGGLLGNQFGKSSGKTVATIGGVIVGAFVGGSIGRSMDQVDQACAAQALEYVPDRRTVTWQGAQQYSVTPMRSYQASNGRYCREYQSSALIGDRVQQVYGTACRGPDGAWQIVK
jgi:surface antigen